MNFDIHEISLENIRTLNEFVENAIGMPFKHDYLRDFTIDKTIAEKLENAAKEYNKQFRSKEHFFDGHFDQNGAPVGKSLFPERVHHESRLGLFSQSRTVTRSRSIQGHSFIGIDYFKEVKRYLMFSHKVFIDMPFFVVPRIDIDVTAWLDKVKSDLLNYAKMDSLIKRRIVIPIEVFSLRPVDFQDIWLRPYGDFNADPKANVLIRQIAHSLRSQMPSVGKKDAELAAIKSIMVQSDAKACSNFYDPLVAEDLTAFALKHALLKINTGISSKDVIVPVINYGISSNYAISPDAVSIEDIIAMRENELVFSEWRAMLSEIFGKMSENVSSYNDPSKEFNELVEDRSRDWQQRAEKSFGKGFKASIRDTGKDTAYSITAGIIAASLIPSKGGLILAGVSPATRLLVKIFGSLMTSSSNRRVRVSLKNHFLTVGTRARD